MIAGMLKTDFSGYSDCLDGAIKTPQVALPPKEQRRFLLHMPLTRLDKAVTWRLSDDLRGMDDLEQDDIAFAQPSCSRCLFDRVIQTSGDAASGHHALAGDETETCHPGNHVLCLPCCREARCACDLRHKGWKAVAAGIHV